jgi:hypothetical protein
MVWLAKARCLIMALMLLFMAGALAHAQGTDDGYHVDGLHLQHATASMSAGYDGQYGTDESSSHDLGLSGNLSTGGYYYNPNFLSFIANSYYDRAESNADSASLNTSKGYNVSAHVFGGSSTPGNVNLGQSWGNNGTYGIPGLVGATSTTNSRDFGVSWLFKRVAFLRNVGVGFADDAGHMEILGLGITADTHVRSYSIGTGGYQIAGFPLSGGYEHLTSSTTSNLSTGGGSVSNGTSTTDLFKFATGHALPMRGKMILSAYRIVSNNSSGTTTGKNVSNEVDAAVTSRVWRLPISGNINYNDNVYGSMIQELNISGQTVLVADNSPRIGTLLMNVSSSYTFPHHVFLTGYASRQDEYVGGATVGQTTCGGNVSYNFGKILNGLTIIAGMHDSASQAGNSGAGMIATVTYTKTLNGWHISANFNYNQNVQTMLALYTSSSMSTSASVRRQVRHGLQFGVSGNYGRSVFNEQSGTSNYSESVSGNISQHKQSATFYWARSGGQAIMTSTGLSTLPISGVPNVSVPFSGHSYSAGYSNNMVKRLTVAVGWNKFMSDSSTTGVLSNVSSTNYTGSLNYNYRKLNFIANASRLKQGVSVTSALPNQYTVYYFGVSRWFNFF